MNESLINKGNPDARRAQLCVQRQRWKTNRFDEEGWSRQVGLSVSSTGESKGGV